MDIPDIGSLDQDQRAWFGTLLTQRAITYGGQLAGTAAAALLETLTEEEDED